MVYKPHEYYSYLRIISHSYWSYKPTNLAIENGGPCYCVITDDRTVTVIIKSELFAMDFLDPKNMDWTPSPWEIQYLGNL